VHQGFKALAPPPQKEEEEARLYSGVFYCKGQRSEVPTIFILLPPKAL
jgi:hypothetical protein